MKLLPDEDVPKPLLPALQRVLTGHEVIHVDDGCQSCRTPARRKIRCDTRDGLSESNTVGALVALVMSGDLLAPGRHRATLAEIEDLFVTHAPFTTERRRIFTGLNLYIEEVKLSLPSTTAIWVDGGFVTHKRWAAPHDVDVACPVVLSDFLALDEWRRRELFSWFLPNDDKVQPMGGLVDGFVFDGANTGRAAYWDWMWSRVTDAAKNEVPGAAKGYLEVAI